MIYVQKLVLKLVALQGYLLACLLEEVPDDEVPGPLFSLPLGTSSILELGPWLLRLL